MSAFEQAVLSDLESRGWTVGKPRQAREGLMYRANDGAGSTDAQTVLVKDSIAVITFHRPADIPAGWRSGRDAADGSATAFITARDLRIDAPAPAIRPQSPARPERDPLDPARIAEIRTAWDAKAFPRDDHPQLTKRGGWVHPSGLREYPAGHRHAGDLLAPMFRPVSGASRGIELCGAQQLLRDTSRSPDKYIVAGSKAAGAFVPLPLRESFFRPGAALDDDWLPAGARIVVTEGVRTGQAVRSATAGWAQTGARETVVLAALAANNLPAVARWLKSSGMSATHEVVFAADNDGPKSQFVGIRKAVEAAELCGGKVALVDGDKPGFDVYDVLATRKHDLRAGQSAVRELIDGARDPSQIRADRAEAFEPQQRQGTDRGNESIRAAGVER